MTEPLPDNLAALLAEFSRSDARELHVRRGEIEIYLSKDERAKRVRGAPTTAPVLPRPDVPAPPSAARPPAAPASGGIEIPAGATIITAPNLGTFYRAPKPGAADYVEIGSTVAVGDEVCLIEVMKLFTAVRSEVAGQVRAVLAEDGAMVEAGQPLFAVGGTS